MTKRLIDANALVDDTYILNSWDAPIVRAWLDEQPTVDAVEVVRCKYCKHWDSHGNGYGQCRHPRFHIENEIDPTTTQGSFCDNGERR